MDNKIPKLIRRFFEWFAIGVLAFVAILSLFLIVLIYYHLVQHYGFSDFNSFLQFQNINLISVSGRAFLVLIASIGGIVAIWELSNNRFTTRVATNAAFLAQYKMYLSIEYQQQVRRPAWLALLKASEDDEYRALLLDGLAGVLVGDEARGPVESSQKKADIGERDQALLKVHDDYHRVQDILGFFTTLSLLNPSRLSLQMCNFFYDRWRCPLHWIVEKLEDYQPPEPHSNNTVLMETNKRRVKSYIMALNNLDALFELKQIKFSCEKDSRFPRRRPSKNTRC